MPTDQATKRVMLSNSISIRTAFDFLFADDFSVCPENKINLNVIKKEKVADNIEEKKAT